MAYLLTVDRIPRGSTQNRIGAPSHVREPRTFCEARNDGMSHILTTGAVAPQDRAAFWNDVICDVFVQLDCAIRADYDFSGRIRQDCAAHLRMAEVVSNAQRVSRTPRQIAKSAEDFFLVSFQAEGVGMVRQDGREALLRAGDFALYDSTRPYELTFPDNFRQIVLMLPGAPLRAQLRDTERLTASAVNGLEGAGHLIIGMADALRDSLDRLQPPAVTAVAQALQDILLAGLRTLPAARRAGTSDLTAYHIARAKQYALRHLSQPDLSVAAIGAAIGISAAHLHRLFRCEPESPAQWLWTQRLEACKRALADPAYRGRSVSALAFSWGFNDAAHFSRAFKQRYGMPPSAWRAQCGPPGIAS